MFCDALAGPPTSWVPPCVFPSLIPPSSEYEGAHIPLEREGCLDFACTGTLVFGPTSLKRGEGLRTGLSYAVERWLGTSLGGDGDGGGWDERRMNQDQRLMIVDLRFKLRSHPQ